MPLAQAYRGGYDVAEDDVQFRFPERVFGPVREVRRSLGGGAWEDEGMEYDMPMRGPPAYRGGYYEYDEADFAAPLPMARPPMRRGAPPMGMGYQRNFQQAYFKPQGFVEETAMRTYRSTPPPPSLLDDMARFRANTPPPAMPMGGMGMGGSMMGGTMSSMSSMSMMGGGMMDGTAVRRRSFGRVSPVPFGGATVMSQQMAMGQGQIISETVTEVPVGYDVWEEEIVRPIVAPIMETVAHQEPMIVEKRITQETVAPIVMQEMGMAQASTVVEAAPMAAPTIIQEMGMAAAPTIVSEYGAMEAPTIIQEMGAVDATVITEGYGEPMMMSEWETRPATIIREADSSLPPVMSGTMSNRTIVVNEPPMPAPIIVPDDSPIFVNEQVPIATPPGIGSFQGGQQPFGPMGGMNSFGGPGSNFGGMNNNFGGMNNGPFPSNTNNMNMASTQFGGTNDLNNVAVTEKRDKKGLKKITAKFHRHKH